MEYPTQRLQDAVEALSQLPGVGRKTALRLALHLLKQPESLSHQLANSLVALRTLTRRCTRCNNLSDNDLCRVCASPKRNATLLCVVAEPTDLLALERSGHYTGLYHVLGGLISPMDGIGPDRLSIEALVERCRQEGVEEVILALNASLEGETTAFYVAKRLRGLPVRVSTLARGIPVGHELEYTDELTLGRSLQNRQPYAQNDRPDPI